MGGDAYKMILKYPAVTPLQLAEMQVNQKGHGHREITCGNQIISCPCINTVGESAPVYVALAWEEASDQL